MFGPVLFKSSLVLAQESLPMFNWPKHGYRAIIVAGSTNADAATQVEAVAWRSSNRFAEAWSTIDDREAASRNVIEEHWRATANTRNAVAAHSSAARRLVEVINHGEVRDAPFLGTTKARRTWPVAFQAILIELDVGSFALFIVDTPGAYWAQRVM